MVARRAPGLRRNREPCDRLTGYLECGTFAHGQVVAALLLLAARATTRPVRRWHTRGTLYPVHDAAPLAQRTQRP